MKCKGKRKRRKTKETWKAGSGKVQNRCRKASRGGSDKEGKAWRRWSVDPVEPRLEMADSVVGGSASPSPLDGGRVGALSPLNGGRAPHGGRCSSRQSARTLPPSSSSTRAHRSLPKSAPSWSPSRMSRWCWRTAAWSSFMTESWRIPL